MERLTNHIDYCKRSECKFYDAELYKQGRCKFLKTSIENCHKKRMNDKLREYEDAEEQGLLIRLPCKVGDPIVCVEEYEDGYDYSTYLFMAACGDFDIVRIVKTIEALRGIGFRKSDIESLKIPWTVMKSIGMKESERMIVTMSDIKNSEMFGLALEVSQKMNEEEARCYLDLKQKMR